MLEATFVLKCLRFWNEEAVEGSKEVNLVLKWRSEEIVMKGLRSWKKKLYFLNEKATNVFLEAILVLLCLRFWNEEEVAVLKEVTLV